MPGILSDGERSDWLWQLWDGELARLIDTPPGVPNGRDFSQLVKLAGIMDKAGLLGTGSDDSELRRWLESQMHGGAEE